MPNDLTFKEFQTTTKLDNNLETFATYKLYINWLVDTKYQGTMTAAALLTQLKVLNTWCKTKNFMSEKAQNQTTNNLKNIFNGHVPTPAQSSKIYDYRVWVCFIASLAISCVTPLMLTTLSSFSVIAIIGVSVPATFISFLIGFAPIWYPKKPEPLTPRVAVMEELELDQSLRPLIDEFTDKAPILFSVNRQPSDESEGPVILLPELKNRLK